MMVAPAARAGAVSLYSIVQMNMDCLRVFPTDRPWTRHKISPFAPNHNIRVTTAEPHLGVGELSLPVGDHHRTLKAEGLLEPVEGGKRILVEYRRAFTKTQPRGKSSRELKGTFGIQLAPRVRWQLSHSYKGP
jgi:hypothetical protein